MISKEYYSSIWLYLTEVSRAIRDEFFEIRSLRDTLKNVKVAQNKVDWLNSNELILKDQKYLIDQLNILILKKVTQSEESLNDNEEIELSRHISTSLSRVFPDVFNRLEQSTQKLIADSDIFRKHLSNYFDSTLLNTDAQDQINELKYLIISSIEGEISRMDFIADMYKDLEIIDSTEHQILKIFGKINSSMQNNFTALDRISFIHPKSPNYCKLDFKQGKQVVYTADNWNSFNMIRRDIIQIQLKVLDYFNLQQTKEDLMI